MPPTCSVCAHEKVRQINRDLVLGVAMRDFLGRYGITKSAAHRHRSHLADQLEAAKIANGISAHGILLKLCGKLETMADRVEAEGGDRPTQRMFLDVVDRLTRAADSFAKVNREVVTSTFHLFAQLGVRDEGEIRSALELARGAQHLTLDDCELDGVELLRMVISQRPERRAAIVRALDREASGAEVVESNGSTAPTLRPHQASKVAPGSTNGG